MKTWLVIDMNYLCHRAFHSTGNLTYQDVDTGVVFGVIRELIALRDLFNPKRFIFCFDSGKNLRREKYPKYKQGRRKRRREMDEDARAAYDGMKRQICVLRFDVLKSVGFSNVFWQIGFEADDIIAAITQKRPTSVAMIMVGADHDLYQLLVGQSVIMWNINTHKMVNARSFSEEYGVTPSQWADVKAIAGCSSDDVQGVKGVGEKTACKYLNGTLKTGKKFEDIVAKTNIWQRNLELVRLPMEGTVRPVTRPDKVHRAKWAKMCRKYGFKTLEREW